MHFLIYLNIFFSNYENRTYTYFLCDIFYVHLSITVIVQQFYLSKHAIHALILFFYVFEFIFVSESLEVFITICSTVVYFLFFDVSSIYFNF